MAAGPRHRRARCRVPAACRRDSRRRLYLDRPGARRGRGGREPRLAPAARPRARERRAAAHARPRAGEEPARAPLRDGVGHRRERGPHRGHGDHGLFVPRVARRMAHGRAGSGPLRARGTPGRCGGVPARSAGRHRRGARRGPHRPHPLRAPHARGEHGAPHRDRAARGRDAPARLPGRSRRRPAAQRTRRRVDIGGGRGPLRLATPGRR